MVRTQITYIESVKVEAQIFYMEYIIVSSMVNFKSSSITVRSASSYYCYATNLDQLAARK